MQRAAFALLLIITFAACDPGPMPDVPRRLTDAERREDWFPSTSYDPYQLDDAILNDRTDEVRRLLKSGADPNRRWSQSGDRFPLQEVIDQGGQKISNDTQIVRLLLEHGANPNARWCPFESRGPSYGDSPSCTSAKGTTALSYAAILGRRDIVTLLLDAGAQTDAEDWMGRSALDYATDDVVFELISRAMFPDLETRDRKALAWLDRNFTNPFTPSQRETPLARTLLWGRVNYDGRRLHNSLRIVLSLGADPNERTGDGRTPLSIALETSLPSAKLLLQQGADVNQRWCEVRPKGKIEPACTMEKGITPLMWASRWGSAELVKLLLDHKADRLLTDWAGRTALDYATDPRIRGSLQHH